jgi:hypothetical protein
VHGSKTLAVSIFLSIIFYSFPFSESFPSQRDDKPSLESLVLNSRKQSSDPIPVINIIKAEPPDIQEDRDLVLAAPSQSPSPVKLEPMEVPSLATTSLAPPLSPSGPRFFFPNLSLPHPYQHYLLSKLESQSDPPAAEQLQKQQHLEENKLSLSSLLAHQQQLQRRYPTSSPSFFASQPPEQQLQLEVVSSNKKSPGGGSPAKHQAFKCQKCGKSYNWNYNLNRHMRFECGIENKFECAVCHKRFPYKQNAAIHLKRKHKVQLENADDMLAAGHIVLMAGQPRLSA